MADRQAMAIRLLGNPRRHWHLNSRSEAGVGPAAIVMRFILEAVGEDAVRSVNQEQLVLPLERPADFSVGADDRVLFLSHPHALSTPLGDWRCRLQLD